MKRLAKIAGGILAAYVLFVIVFEAGYLGYAQPSFEEQGIPMLVLITTDRETGESNPRMLARLQTEEAMYVSAHHWPRGWYHSAVDNPAVVVEIDGVQTAHIAVPVQGAEFEAVSARFPLPLPVRFLMGFPPERDILRLDPVPAAT